MKATIPVQATHDEESGMWYIQLVPHVGPGGVARSRSIYDHDEDPVAVVAVLDFGHDGELVGIEIFDPTWIPESLARLVASVHES